MPELLKDKSMLSKEFRDAMSKEGITAEGQLEAIENYVQGIHDSATAQVKREYAELSNVHDDTILASRGIHVLTSEETKFYNDATKAGGFDSDTVWPETIIERVFDDIVKERPLLKLINFTLGVAKEKVIRSRRKGVAVWGELHKDVEGQLDVEFDATTKTQLALTAFMLISNDTLELGPRWIDRYVRLCLTEAIGDAWEKVIVNGTGKNQPIGLIKDLKKDIQSGAYQDKDSTGTLTFADAPTMVKELAGVLKAMSKYKRFIGDKDKTGTDETRKVAGKVYLLINPTNYYDIVARVTTQNANGAFVTNLPFISQDHIIESTEVPENKLIVYLDGQYDAEIAMASSISVYKETFAMKRATLYVTDLLGNGRPVDNYASLVYDVQIPS